MYRVIIVDDERWALVGIRKFLERGSDQFEVVFETTNPLEALDAICEQQPDLVFTDIRMPEITGIDLIEKARQRGSTADFVIISGFSEFAYAQQALRAGALDYLLKPLDIPNARGILAKIQKQLDTRHRLDDMNLYGMLHSGNDDPTPHLQARLPQPLMPCWQIAAVILKDDAAPVQLSLPSPCQSFWLQLGPHKFTYLINSDVGYRQQLYDACAAMEDQIVSCGLSPVVDSTDKLSTLVRVAEFAIYDHFIYPGIRICDYQMPQPTKVFNIWQQLSKDLRTKHYDHLKRSLMQLPEQFRLQRLTANDALSLWNLIAENIYTFLPDSDALSDITPLRVHSLADKFDTMETMCQYLIAQLTQRDYQGDGSANQHFKQMLRFVEMHYMENLNLQSLCEQFYINVSYCCELFRRETQMTFTQYITNLRMEETKKMLRETTLPLKEICERIGYNDYFYFDKVFKKNVGCTPSEYRKNHE